MVFLEGILAGEQLIKNEYMNFESIKFNAVSKELKFTNNQQGLEVEFAKKLINNWFNNNVKVNGFDGLKGISFAKESTSP